MKLISISNILFDINTIKKHPSDKILARMLFYCSTYLDWNCGIQTNPKNAPVLCKTFALYDPDKITDLWEF